MSFLVGSRGSGSVVALSPSPSASSDGRACGAPSVGPSSCISRSTSRSAAGSRVSVVVVSGRGWADEDEDGCVGGGEDIVK